MLRAKSLLRGHRWENGLAIVETAGAAAWPGIDDADVVGAAPAGATPHAAANRIEFDFATQLGRQAVQVDACHPRNNFV